MRFLAYLLFGEHIRGPKWQPRITRHVSTYIPAIIASQKRIRRGPRNTRYLPMSGVAKSKLQAQRPLNRLHIFAGYAPHPWISGAACSPWRSEEHTSELQSLTNLV